MRIPRDLSGYELADLLSQYGYKISRQSGNHMHFTTTENGEHYITIPNHKQLRVDTLSAMLIDVADHFCLEREDIINKLVEK